MGPERTVSEMRKVNEKLRHTSSSYYPPMLADAAGNGLDMLERSVQGVRKQDAVARWWHWYERLEKDNPTLANAVSRRGCARRAATPRGARLAGAPVPCDACAAPTAPRPFGR